MGISALARITQEPWAITPEGMNWVIAAVERGMTGIGAGAELPWQRALKAQESQGPVAVIPISGPLAKGRGGIFDVLAALFGASTYDSIKAAFDAALADDAVKRILFVVDSPGGEVTGASELSKHIFSARGQKPIDAHVVGMNCSAAYWLTSACDSISVDPTAVVGSIGAMRTLIDDSKQQDIEGVKTINVVSDQSPYKAIDPSKASDIARVKEMVTSVAEVFIGDVARNRGVTDKFVKQNYGKGDVFIGAQAVTAGLADQVATLEQTLARVTNTKGSSMEIEAKAKDTMCAGCDKSMKAGSKMYCSGCRAKAEFAGEVLSLLACEDSAQALGKLAALKASAEEGAKLRAELDKLAAEKQAGEVKALIDEAVRDGRVKPARREHVEALYAKHGGEFLRAYLAELPKAAAPAREPSGKVEQPEGAAIAVALTEEEKQIAKATGVSLEKFAQSKSEMRATNTLAEQE